METRMSQSYIFFSTTKQSWEAFKLTYSNMGNNAQLYDLKQRLPDSKQGNQFVTTYYNTMNWFWQEMDPYQDHDWKWNGPLRVKGWEEFVVGSKFKSNGDKNLPIKKKKKKKKKIGNVLRAMWGIRRSLKTYRFLISLLVWMLNLIKLRGDFLRESLFL